MAKSNDDIKSPDKTKLFNYASKMAELESTMSLLNNDLIDIDDAVKAYEKGMKTITEIETYLAEAETTITKIKANFDK